jgi:hypothetical protein
MGKRYQADQTPATLDAVVAAVVAASRYDESELQEMASEGTLRKLFPFKPHAVDIPPDTMPRDQLRRASALPLDRNTRKALIQSSMPSRIKQLARARAQEFEEFAAEWDVDNGQAAAYELKTHD